MTSGGYGGDFRYNAAGVGADTASWTFSVPPGQYLISTTWLPYYNRATNAPYTVYDGDRALGTVTVNQRNSPSGLSDQGKSWTKLNYAGNQGIFTITSGTLTVRLSDAANGYVIADAVRVEQMALVVAPSAMAAATSNRSASVASVANVSVGSANNSGATGGLSASSTISQPTPQTVPPVAAAVVVAPSLASTLSQPAKASSDTLSPLDTTTLAGHSRAIDTILASWNPAKAI